MIKEIYYRDPIVIDKYLNLSGYRFWTDRDVPFAYVRGRNAGILGWPEIDVSKVNNQSGKAIIYLQNRSEHLTNTILQLSLYSDERRLRSEIGFNGVELDSKTKFDTDYMNGKYDKGEFHNSQMNIISRGMNIAVNIPKSNRSNTSHDIKLNDLRSRQGLVTDGAGTSNIDIVMQSWNLFKESERELPYNVIDGYRNTISVRGEVAMGKKMIDGEFHYGHKYALKSGGDNVLINDHFAKWFHHNGNILWNDSEAYRKE